ncbi:MerR family transcriptional regulator [Beijerinckia sp. L45]|uniref:MerR family transcriptional regulator n=1 Tax=Beijerinckia sp. L45 TaxID=1641855 RepID=UPI00131CDD7B|nr:MerR family transcriptional regulator [Beijerinckia sp. L45]
MLISEFARATGLTSDTVRFYVRLGLLRPCIGAKGGRLAYQVFSESDVSAAKLIRLSQAAGLSLKEIAAFGGERRAGRMTPERRMEIVSAQIEKLEGKAAELSAMANYLRAKRDWLANGKDGMQPEPGFVRTEGRSRIAADRG